MNFIKKIYDKVFPKWKMTTYDKITYCNWWDYDNADDEWFTQFIRINFPQYAKYNISFCSVFGDIRKIEKISNKKIFYTGEAISDYVRHSDLHINEEGNVYKLHKSWMLKYGHDWQDTCNLSMGFSDLKKDKYIRFPIWIWRCFLPIVDFKYIKRAVDRINTYNQACLPQRECILVASHDDFGTRAHIYDRLKNTLDITSAGKWRHNSDELWHKYPFRDKLGKDKIDYMKDFKFNICPENMDAPNYVTEKIFDAFQAGAIPIYHGALNNPEPEIINKDAVIFWDYEGDNKGVINLIGDLNRSSSQLEEFLHIPRLKENAAECIYNKMYDLKNHIERLLE